MRAYSIASPAPFRNTLSQRYMGIKPQLWGCRTPVLTLKVKLFKNVFHRFHRLGDEHDHCGTLFCCLCAVLEGQDVGVAQLAEETKWVARALSG